MNLFRRLPTTRLLALIAAVTAIVVISVVGIAAAVGDDPQPPPAKPLAEAIHDALVAPPVQGVTARIDFKNDLVDAGAFEGVSPLISGASGRLWWSADHFRVELQGNSGDAQIVADDKSFWIYDGQSNTVYRGSFPADKKAGRTHKAHGVPTVAQIQNKLTKVLRYAGIAGPDPGVEGGQPSYSVKVTPRKHGGLLGAVGVAWDAAHGIPLRVGLYPKGSDSPVVELKATDVTFGAVDPAAFSISPPAGAKVVDLRQDAQHRQHLGKLTFALKKPPLLAGRKLQGVRRIPDGAISVYGKGLDAIVVVQHAGAAPAPSGKHQKLQLGTTSIDGATATVLETPLGSGLTWSAGGVTYTVAGSVTRDVAEQAARGL